MAEEVQYHLRSHSAQRNHRDVQQKSHQHRPYLDFIEGFPYGGRMTEPDHSCTQRDADERTDNPATRPNPWRPDHGVIRIRSRLCGV